jgi:hypothetical protein
VRGDDISAVVTFRSRLPNEITVAADLHEGVVGRRNKEILVQKPLMLAGFWAS